MGRSLGAVKEISDGTFEWFGCVQEHCPKVWLVCANSGVDGCKNCKTQFDPEYFKDSESKKGSKKAQLRRHLREHHPNVQLPPIIERPPNAKSNKRQRLLVREDFATPWDDESDNESTTSFDVVTIERTIHEDDLDEVSSTSDDEEASSLAMESIHRAKLDGLFRKVVVDAKQLARLPDDPYTIEDPEEHLVLSQLKELKSGMSVFQRDSSIDFFLDQKRGVAALNLVKRVLYEGDCNRELAIIDVARFFLFVRFTWMLTTKEQRHFASLVSLFLTNHDYCSKCNHFIPPISFIPRPIHTFNSLNAMVFKGKHSLAELLPHPRVRHFKGDDCVYISIIETLAHILHSDNPPNYDKIEKRDNNGGEVNSLTESQYAQEKLDQFADFHFLMMTWQDGFEPNYSVKANRLKVWVKTATISLKKRAMSSASAASDIPDVWKTTFPIALGREQSSKCQVEAEFYREMKVLDTVGGIEFFHGRLKKTVKVRVSLSLVRGDQPERRKMCGTVGIRGNNGPAFGIIGNCKEIHRNLPSCDECLATLIADRRIIKDCQRCLNWEFFREDTELNLYPPPEDYPHEEIPACGMLRFKKMEFEDLKNACDRAHEARVKQEWEDKHVKAYLKAHALNDETVNGVLSHAKLCLMKQVAHATKKDDPQAYLDVMEQVKNSPELFTKWKHHPIWNSGVRMVQVVCIIMHLLFLGIVKTLLTQTMLSWLKTFNKNSNFIRSAQGVLESVECLHLPQWKILPYKEGTAGPWVSENYLAFAKLSTWFYSLLLFIDAEDFVPEPEFPQDPSAKKNRWKANVCTSWLKRRNLDSKGKHDAKWKRIVDLHKSPLGPPTPLEKEPSPRHAALVIQAAFAMISRLMCRKTSPEVIHDADLHVRIFLTYYSRFDEMMKSNMPDLVPSWVSAGNFLSLPRLIEAMTQFGPLLSGWEGGVEGEGILKHIKPEIKSGSSSPMWHMNCCLKLLRTLALQLIESSEEMKPHLDEVAPERHRKQPPHPGYRAYDDPSVPIAAFAKNKPISGFVTEEGEFCFCVKATQTCGRSRVQIREAHSVTRIDEGVRKINNMAYHKWDISIDQTPVLISEKNVMLPVLFLPELCSGGLHTREKERGMYAVIDSEWRVLDESVNFSLPQVENWLEETPDANAP